MCDLDLDLDSLKLEFTYAVLSVRSVIFVLDLDSLLSVWSVIWNWIHLSWTPFTYAVRLECDFCCGLRFGLGFTPFRLECDLDLDFHSLELHFTNAVLSVLSVILIHWSLLYMNLSLLTYLSSLNQLTSLTATLRCPALLGMNLLLPLLVEIMIYRAGIRGREDRGPHCYITSYPASYTHPAYRR